VSELPNEAERLLSARPDEFVDERKRIAEELRDAGRAEDAAIVAGLRKPTVVVLAVNRAARDRPQAAKDAAKAALLVRETQLSGDQDAYRKAVHELERSLDLLAEVAVAHAGREGKAASDSMRQRVRDLLRSAVADDDAREALVRGALVAETEASGFGSFAGMSPPAPRKAKKQPRDKARRSAEERERRVREKALRDDLARAERALQEAQRSVAKAEREREKAASVVAEARAALDGL
jgi:hypothetical protein